MVEQTFQCPICKKPYIVYFQTNYTGDQSTCISCREKARKILNYLGCKVIDTATDKDNSNIIGPCFGK